MIPRISRGASAWAGLGYDHGPGRRDEHENPHKVAGNVAGRTWQERARAMDRHTKVARPQGVAKPLHRTSLRVAGTDRALTDAEWRQVAGEYVARMGFTGCPWEATRHAGDHIHITVNRVRWDGTLVDPKHDYAKAQAACRVLERRHGLADASRKFDRGSPQVSKGERESAQRRQVVPEREQLREKITAAERGGDGTRTGYEQALSRQGVLFRANVSKTTGRVSGYSYGLPGHTTGQKGDNATGKEQVWFKGSQLGGQFAWSKTAQRLEAQEQAHRPQETDTGRGEAVRKPVSRQEAREQARTAAQQRGAVDQREDGRGHGRPGPVRADQDNAGRAGGENTARGRAQDTQQGRDARMEGTAHRVGQQQPGGDRDAGTDTARDTGRVPLTREAAGALAEEAARARQEERARREQDKGRER